MLDVGNLSPTPVSLYVDHTTWEWTFHPDCLAQMLGSGPHPLSGTAVGQTDFDVTIGQCVMSDKNLACTILMRHKTMSDGERSEPVCSHSNCMFCPTVPGSRPSRYCKPCQF